MQKLDILKTVNVKVFKRGKDDSLEPLRVSIRDRRVRFTMSTSRNLNMNSSQRIAFIQLDGINWYLVFTTEEDGYRLFKDNKRAGYSCNASKIARSIVKSINPGKDAADCVLEITNYEYKGQIVYKIINRIG